MTTINRARCPRTFIIFFIMSMSTLFHMIHGFTTKSFSFSIIPKYSSQHSTFKKFTSSSSSSACTYTTYYTSKNKPCLFQYYHNNQFRLFASTRSSNSDDNDNNTNTKARVLFLGTPDVAATTLKTIVEASQKENW